jgi:hypothetical protein
MNEEDRTDGREEEEWKKGKIDLKKRRMRKRGIDDE